MQLLRHNGFARLLPLVLMTAALGLEVDSVEHPEIATQDTAFRGVWYACGTENALPGRKYVYAGGKATYSAWHHPMEGKSGQIKGRLRIKLFSVARDCKWV